MAPRGKNNNMARQRNQRTGKAPRGLTSGRISKAIERELKKPAGYIFDGSRMATLGELVDPNIPTTNLVELTEDQVINLIIKRLEMEPNDFKIAMIGIGIVDKTRAIAEVKSRTKIGRNIVEIERHLISMLESKLKATQSRDRGTNA